MTRILEKQSLLADDRPTDARPSKPTRLRKCLLVLLLVSMTCHAFLPLYRYHSSTSKSRRGSKLKWRNCGEIASRPLECARLDVPLDHFGTGSEKRTISIPLIRMTSKSATKTILLNPGGPGGSGFEFVHRRGAQLSHIVGDGFHLLSFDPRGVNSSIPRSDCFPTDDVRRKAWASRPRDVETQFGEYVARARNLAQACEDVMGDIGRYINTPQTAADMNVILDAIHQEEMYYWGFSYGTTLGQTYAQMFPNRVHRLVIDGVSNQDYWYASNQVGGPEEWQDTEATYKEMLVSCFESGSRACPLSAGFDSGEELYHNTTLAMEALKVNPMAVYLNASTFGELHYSDVAGAVFSALYKPTNWPILVEDLREFIHGNATSLYLKYGATRDDVDPRLAGEASLFVGVGDAARVDPSAKYTQNELMALITPITKKSPLSADDTAEGIFIFDAWTVPRSHNFTPAVRVETAYPLLILSTTLDPVCPLISASSAQAKYVDSVLLRQEGAGHCSVSMPSKCMMGHIRAFFYDGTLPDPGSVCGIDIPYYLDPDRDLPHIAGFDEEKLELVTLAQSAAAPRWARV